LHYSDEALKAARTGHIRIASAYFPDRAIYSTDSFVFREDQAEKVMLLPKQRGQMRLIKAVAEGKARSFNHKDLYPILISELCAFSRQEMDEEANFLTYAKNVYLLQQTDKCAMGKKHYGFIRTCS